VKEILKTTLKICLKIGSWAEHNVEIACASVLYNLKIDLYTVDNVLKNISKITYIIPLWEKVKNQ
jgi:hypothetical protein